MDKQWFFIHINSECIRCSRVEKEMVRVGALIFCIHCFDRTFDVKANKRNEKNYKKWLKVYKRKGGNIL